MPIWKDEKKNRRDYVEVTPSRAEDLWLRCQSCGELVFRKKLAQNSYICPHCGAYFFLSAEERIASLVDEGSAVDITVPLVTNDPLRFVDRKPYPNRVKEAQRETGLLDAVKVVEARIEGHSVVLAVMDFRFIGGSMGSVVGEELCLAMERAVERSVPFVLIAASGGARVQEGVLSLMQMPKTVLVRGKLAEAGVPYIAVFTYPTTGGVLASIASLADITLAERGTKIGFAGPRVIEQTTKEKLPPDFQTEDFALARGMVDRVVRREELRAELAKILSLFDGGRDGG
jgi:acetyl-CoA carboxylase carboxyl transferase subunit beta